LGKNLRTWIAKLADLFARLPKAVRQFRRQNRLSIARRLRSTFGPLLERFMKPTEWLSQRIPSLNEIRAERLTRPEDVSQDRHQAHMLWLHRHENNVRIAVPALAFVVATSVVGGAVYDYLFGVNPSRVTADPRY